MKSDPSADGPETRVTKLQQLAVNNTTDSIEHNL